MPGPTGGFGTPMFPTPTQQSRCGFFIFWLAAVPAALAVSGRSATLDPLLALLVASTTTMLIVAALAMAPRLFLLAARRGAGLRASDTPNGGPSAGRSLGSLLAFILACAACCGGIIVTYYAVLFFASVFTLSFYTLTASSSTSYA